MKNEQIEEKQLYPHNALRQLKSLRKMKMEDIAKAANVSIVTVDKAMNGSPTVGLEKFASIADALGADVEINLRLRDPELLDGLLPANNGQTIAQAVPAQ